jgi:hypothetical protein
MSKRSQGGFRSQPRIRAPRDYNSSVANENKLEHDRKLQNIYEKSLRHYHDISQISSLMKNQLETSNYNKAHDFNLRENRSQEELPKYQLSGRVLPRIGGAGNDDIYHRYKHKPRIQLKDRIREQELLGRNNLAATTNSTLNHHGFQRRAMANKNYIMQQYATASDQKIPKKSGGTYTISYNRNYEDPGFPSFDYNGKHSIGAKAANQITKQDKEFVRRQIIKVKTEEYELNERMLDLI